MSPIGILAALAIVIGSVLLVTYALRRGLVHRELDGMSDEPEPGAPVAAGHAAPPRALGMLGVVALVVGLGLGAIAVAGSSTPAGTSNAPGSSPSDCAQSWDGCPQATANP